MPGPDSRPAAAAVTILNRQRRQPVCRESLAALAASVARRLGVGLELGIHLVSAREMARVNWQFLRHEGSTDVITFDHGSTATHLHGELFISIEDAESQAGEFGTDWNTELARYVIHGLLHLHGHDDLTPEPRRVMKRLEGRLVRQEAALAAGLKRVRPRRRSARTRRP